ncbi:MBL fold metallo-hydrolase [Sphingomonas sanxanigenens]|nr:MBL fold metallo-hydrolase [Sphingomonas sanxanigenens]
MTISILRRTAAFAGRVLFFAVVAALLAVQIVPPFLDRIYYRGPESGHFDGQRFFNPDGDDLAGPPGSNRGGRAGFFYRWITGADGRPLWPATVPVTPSRPAVRVEGDALVATWVGHATVLVQTRGLNILTDPIWAETAGPFGFGAPRTAPPGIRLADLPPIDLILVSHNHYDHMDLATLKTLWDRDHPRIVTSPGNDTLLRDAGIDRVTVLDWGGHVAVRNGVGVAVTRNHHWGSRWFTDRNRALWSSFVVTAPGGNIFFAGDTGAGDLQWPAEARKWGRVRLALLPIGAFRFSEGQMETGAHVGPIDSAEIFARLGAPTGLAVHWGTFRLSYEGYDTPPRLLDAVMRCRPDIAGRFAAVAIGKPVTVPALGRDAAPTPPVSRADVVRCLDTDAVRAMR